MTLAVVEDVDGLDVGAAVDQLFVGDANLASILR